jgi:hypothetical protein
MQQICDTLTTIVFCYWTFTSSQVNQIKFAIWVLTSDRIVIKYVYCDNPDKAKHEIQRAKLVYIPH